MDKMIYCLLLAKSNHAKPETTLNSLKGVMEAGLVAVEYHNISAIISDVTEKQFIVNKQRAVEFALVIDQLAQKYTLLPMRFGSMMDSADSVMEMLERNEVEIEDSLKKVKNKWEYGLKVLCDREKLKEELTAKKDNDTLNFVKPEIGSNNSVYKDYVLKKLNEHRAEEQILSFVDSILVEIKIYLQELKAVDKCKKMTNETTIIDAVFLLDKKKKKEVINLVKDLQQKYLQLNFLLTGPWPPYNFVELNLK
jgi:hypothetical protein